MVVWIEKVTNFELWRKSFFIFFFFFKEIDYLYTEADMKDKKKNKIFVFASFAFQVRLLNSCKMLLRYILGVRADSHLWNLR